jgi:hypothetical protein
MNRAAVAQCDARTAMQGTMSMRRRSVLTILWGIAASMLVRCTSGGTSGVRGSAKRLSDNEVKMLAAAAECVYPQTGAEHGARSLGIEHYLIQQRGTKHYRRKTPTLRHAVRALDEVATSMYGRAFGKCSAEERTGVFDVFARGGDGLDAAETAKAFNLLVDVTLEGCFSHPRHGGNAGMQAWKVMENALQNGWYIECDCGQ